MIRDDEVAQLVDRLHVKFPHMRFCIAAVEHGAAHAMAEQITTLLRQMGWTLFEGPKIETFPDGVLVDYGDDATRAERFFSDAHQAAAELVRELGRVGVDTQTGLGNANLGQYDLQIAVGRNARGTLISS